MLARLINNAPFFEIYKARNALYRLMEEYDTLNEIEKEDLSVVQAINRLKKFIDAARKDINESLNHKSDGLYSSQNGMSLAGALSEKKNNKEIVLEAINDTLELQQDPKILNHVKKLNPTIIEYVQKTVNFIMFDSCMFFI